MTFSVSSFTSHLHKRLQNHLLSILTAGCLHHHTAGTVVIEPLWECTLTVIDSWYDPEHDQTLDSATWGIPTEHFVGMAYASK